MQVTHWLTGHPVWMSLRAVVTEHSQNCPTSTSPFAVSHTVQAVGFAQARQLRWHRLNVIVSSLTPQEPVHDFRLEISFRLSVVEK
jgi:hypothetical protein